MWNLNGIRLRALMRQNMYWALCALWASACAAQADELPTAVRPLSSERPSIEGVARERETLSVLEGSWNSTTPVTFAYKWLRCSDEVACAPIFGANAKTYVPTAKDVGFRLRAVVLATNAAGTMLRMSALCDTVQWAPPLNVKPPALSGSGLESEPLAATAGTWVGNVASRQLHWYRCDSAGCAPMNLSSETYSPTFADVGASFSLEDIATGPGGTASALSKPVEVRAMPPANLTVPEVQGEPREGAPLVASTGTWQWDVQRFEYQWLVCDAAGTVCSEVTHANQQSWTPGIAEVGARVRVRVWAVGAGGVTAAFSSPSAPILHAPPRALQPPAIAGTPRERETLAASVGNWEGTIDQFSHQWLLCDAQGESCTALTAQNAETLVLDSAWLDRAVRVVVTATGPGGSATSTSEAEGPILLAPPLNTAPPSISGLARDGELLTATTGSWAGTITTYAYVWRRCDPATQACVQVGNDAASYRLTASDVGATMVVQVTATNASGMAAAASAPTPTVVGLPPSLQRDPSIAGVLFVGQVLTGGRGEWAGTKPLAFTQQWLRCDALGNACAVIPGATSSRYAIAAADLGHSLRFETSASNDLGSDSAMSPPSGEVLAGYAQAVLADAPVGYWRFGDSGALTQDASGNGANGTFFGGAVQGSAGALPDGSRAAAFDGVSGRVDFGDRYDFTGSSPFTFEAWIRPTVADAWHRRIFEKEEKNAAGQWEGYRLAVNASLGVYCSRWQAGSNAGLTSVPMTQFPLGAWTHVACTYDGASIRMYVNGVLAATKASPTLVAVTSAPFTVGSFSGGGSSSWFAGNLDELAVYDTALSGAQLLAHVDAARAEAPLAFAPPDIEGAAFAGRLLTASTGTWRGALPLQYGWQWSRCDASGSSCTAIAGATSREYRVTVADQNARLRVTVTAGNGEGSASASSTPTELVAPVTPVFECLEAEDALLAGTTRVYGGPAHTVGGTVVLGAQGGGTLAMPFAVPDAQPVTVWARVRAQTNAHNALRVELAGERAGTGAVWDLPISPVLRWQRVTRRGAGSESLPGEPEWPGVLASGTQTLLIAGEESDVEIDAVCISTADVEPDERLPEAPVRAVTRSVADFGAVGDGVTDNSAALQAAFNALAPGEALLVPAGRYRFTSTLTLNRHEVSIVGEGASSVLFADFPATATTNALNVAGGYEGAQFPLLADAVETDREVLVASTAPFQVGDVLLLSSDEWGQAAPNLTTLFFRNRQHLVRVTERRADPAGAVLTLDRPLQSEFTLAHNARAQKFNGLREVVLSNLRIEGTAHPVPADNADINLVLVNRCDRCFFSDLELSYARKSAMEVARALDSSVIRAHVSNATDTGGGGHGYGVAVTRSQGVIVRDSVFDGVMRHGVPVSWGARETFVFRNLFDRGTPQIDKLASVDIHGQDDYGNLVEDNLITGGDEAIIVGGGGTSHGNDGPWNVIRRNRIENADDAILVFKSTFHTVIEGNTLVGSTGYPIRVESGSHDAWVANNVIEGSSGAAIRILNADRAEVRNNDLIPGTGAAIQVSGSTGYVVSGNTLGGAGIVEPGTGTLEQNF